MTCGCSVKAARKTEHLLSHRRRNRNLLAQADDIVRKTDGRRLTMEMEQTAENARRAAIKAAKESRPMSAKKRRFLEDKEK